MNPEASYEGMLDADLIQEGADTDLRIFDNSKRAKIALGVLIAVLVVQVISLVSEFMQIQLLQEFDALFAVDDDILERAEVNDRRQLLIQLLTLAVSVTFIVVFLNWFRRAYGNLHRLKVGGLTAPEVNAVWAWFIPIISLFRPVVLASEIWKHTGGQLQKLGGQDTTASIRGLVLGLWWFFFIGSGVLGRIAAFKTRRDEEISEMIFSSQLVLGSEVMRFLAGAFLAMLILKISGLESMLSRKVLDQGGQVLMKS
ncbi:MAG: DUF4328 domain-containing protein [Flavobacteriales bacterium]